MEQMLHFNPNKRISVDKALDHPYLAGMRDPAMEKTCKDPFSFEFDNEKMGRGQLRELLWEEIRHYHADFPKFPSYSDGPNPHSQAPEEEKVEKSKKAATPLKAME